EAQRAVPFDEFEEHGGAVADRFGEDLQQVTVFVAVHENAASLKLFDGYAHLADPCSQLRVGVIGIGGGQEFDAVGPQNVNGVQNVVRRQGKVLGARGAVEFEEFVDL